MSVTALALTSVAVLAVASGIVCAAPLPVEDVRRFAQREDCGGARPDSEFADRLVSVVMGESHGDPYAIGVNADRARGLPKASLSPANAVEAAAQARALLAAGRSIDLGLAQINDRNLARHGLTVETAFDTCANIRAGADHLAADWRAAAIWQAAHSRYNSGDFVRGAAYAAGIERVLARVRDGRNAVPASPSLPVAVLAPPAEPSPPAPFGVLVRRAGPERPGAAASALVNRKAE